MAMETVLSGALLAGIIRDTVGGDSEGIIYGYRGETAGVEFGDNTEDRATIQHHTVFNAHKTTGRRFSFYGTDAKIDYQKFFSPNSRTIVGWFVSHTGSAMTPSVRHAAVHRELENENGCPLFLLYIALGNAGASRCDIQLFTQTPSRSFRPSAFVVSSIHHDSAREFKATSVFYPVHISSTPSHIIRMEEAVDGALAELETRLGSLASEETESARLNIENGAIRSVLELQIERSAGSNQHNGGP
mmetsp:Transcript_81034/g.158335  ORF Transcript_81034/g.158335 Transcript_81034/m.158335 type:complete len:245 (+) Transcript_81034:192-926(+)